MGNKYYENEYNDEDEDETEEKIREAQDKELNKYNYNKQFHDDKCYKTLKHYWNFTCHSIVCVFKVSGIYLLWILFHYGASHLYVELCVPKTITGFVMSPFMASTPHCKGLRWIIYNAANVINNMWIILGTWICSTILTFNGEKKTTIY
jgi:hypothetical protein